MRGSCDQGGVSDSSRLAIYYIHRPLYSSVLRVCLMHHAFYSMGSLLVSSFYLLSFNSPFWHYLLFYIIVVFYFYFSSSFLPYLCI